MPRTVFDASTWFTAGDGRSSPATKPISDPFTTHVVQLAMEEMAEETPRLQLTTET